MDPSIISYSSFHYHPVQNIFSETGFSFPSDFPCVSLEFRQMLSTKFCTNICAIEKDKTAAQSVWK